MQEHRGYQLQIDPVQTIFGSRICYVKQSGLTLTKVTGLTPELAIEAGKTWVDWRLGSIEPTDDLLFPHQKELISWAVEKGLSN